MWFLKKISFFFVHFNNPNEENSTNALDESSFWFDFFFIEPILFDREFTRIYMNVVHSHELLNKVA